MMDIYEDIRAIAEPSGAIAIAAAKKLAREGKYKKLVAILSGGNMNFRTMCFVSERCETEHYFCVDLEHRPGALLEFCRTLPDWQITSLTFRLIRGKTVFFCSQSLYLTATSIFWFQRPNFSRSS